MFSCASFKGDEHRFMIATLMQRNRCSVMVRDYVFNRDLQIPNVFLGGGSSSYNSSGTVGQNQ